MLDLVITRSGKPWARSSQNTELHGQVASSSGRGLGWEGRDWALRFWEKLLDRSDASDEMTRTAHHSPCYSITETFEWDVIKLQF